MLVRSILSRYTPCDVSDALVQFGVKNGGYLPNLIKRSALSTTQSTVGQAYTVLYAPIDDPRPAIKQSYIDEVPSSSVVVVALPELQQMVSAPYVTVNNALYGGLMLTRASYKKASGTVVFGRIRDLSEHRELNFPVWLYGVGSTAPGPVVKVVGINVPVLVKVADISGTGFQSILINPGDFMVADENGVVRLPIGHTEGPEAQIDLDKVLEYIPKRVNADTKVSEDIKNGVPAAEAQKYWRSKI
ncbi:hypothetical protein PUMCH_000732 [Australozyma saopauloensis]|uniref:4-hydroxy-4-methyl-2-oxoglutarate aldolase n=1 Tax=Australozyma saopauloensis TaxID=291208 RepID=A0AAX4H4M8_9ASCO|nr:hypothetical protein PUMCH_000732 [[Candida] saopauloensis]